MGLDTQRHRRQFNGSIDMERVMKCSSVGGMTSPNYERLRAELTTLVEQRRADYYRLKAADKEITRAELSEAGADYERALARLSRFFQQSGGHPRRHANGL
jgi:hypothetical protein